MTPRLLSANREVLCFTQSSAEMLRQRSNLSPLRQDVPTATCKLVSTALLGAHTRVATTASHAAQETQTKPEGQVHFFIVLSDGKKVYETMLERCGPTQNSGRK